MKCSLPLAFDAVDQRCSTSVCVMHNKLTKIGEFSDLGFNNQKYGCWHAWKTFTTGQPLRLNCILRMEELEDPSDRRKWT